MGHRCLVSFSMTPGGFHFVVPWTGRVGQDGRDEIGGSSWVPDIY